MAQAVGDTQLPSRFIAVDRTLFHDDQRQCRPGAPGRQNFFRTRVTHFASNWRRPRPNPASFSAFNPMDGQMKRSNVGDEIVGERKNCFNLSADVGAPSAQPAEVVLGTPLRFRHVKKKTTTTILIFRNFIIRKCAPRPFFAEPGTAKKQ